MLKEYLAKHDVKLTDRIFASTDVMSHVFARVRNRLARDMCEPELKRFRLYDLRHHYATMLYHRTKDILYVKRQLGHRKIENTLIYTHLLGSGEIEYTCRAAHTMKEACDMIEQGFEYVTTIEDAQLFGKPK